MREGFDNDCIDTGTDGLITDGTNIELTPLDDAVIAELPISQQELSEMIDEAEALDIQPFEDIKPSIETPDTFPEMPINYDEVFEGLDEYDFDGKDFNENSEQLNSLLDGFAEDNWNNMELEGQKEQINGLFDYVNNVLNLDNPPNIEYYNEPEQGNYGGYNPSTNTLSINEYMLYDSNEAADTVAHELWHAYQHERASNPQSPKDFQYQYGFENYIRPDDDFDGYQNQLVEAEARAFADQFKGALAQIRGV
jgi:hypothetical protein